MTVKAIWKEKLEKGLTIWGHPNGTVWGTIKLEYPDRKTEWVQRSLETDSKEQARRNAYRMQAVMEERTERGQSIKKLFVHDYIEKFMAYKKGRVKDGKLSAQRYKIYETTYNTWWSPWVTKKRLAVADVSALDVQEYRLFRESYPESEQWRSDLAEKKRKKESTRGFAQLKTPGDVYMAQELKRIKEMFNWCVSEGVITTSQIPKFPEIDVDSETSEGFTVPEFEAIETYMLKEWIPDCAGVPNRYHERERVHLKMIVMISVGCRVADLTQLHWRDIYKHHNSHKKQDEYYFVSKAKVSGSRELSIPQKLFDRLMKWKAKSKFNDDGDFVFGTRDSNSEAASIDAGLWKQLMLVTGYWLDTNGKRRTMTSVRHTFATWGILAGHSVDDLVHRMRTSRAEFDKTYMDNMPKHDAARYARSVRPDDKSGFETTERPKKVVLHNKLNTVLISKDKAPKAYVSAEDRIREKEYKEYEKDIERRELDEVVGVMTKNKLAEYQ